MDPRLLNDSVFLGQMKFCELRLMKDADLEWMILVPKRNGIIEWTDMTREEQLQLSQEIHLVCVALQQHGKGEKLNIATLGNVVAQFHLHIVYRKRGDRAWPGPIWGSEMNKNFDSHKIEFWRSHLRELFQT